MLKNLMFTIMAAAIAASVLPATATAAGSGRADQPFPKVVSVPVPKTVPNNGKQMYGSYCAPCHGVTGRGNGPMAASLKAQPADLAVLKRNNGGKFPDARIFSILQFGTETPSHGTADMPVWGPVLGKMNQANPEERVLRISNLSRYLETIQAR
jgi:mono/diheme cytochrome c family protein